MNKYLLYMFITLCTIQQFHSQESNGVVALALPVRNSLKFNRYALNPTFSFVREQNKYISFTNKKQWTQFNDAPQSYLFSYSGRFAENIGTGIALFQQDFGVLTTFGGMLNFAYNVNVGRDSNLTFGLNIGAYQSSLNQGRVVVNIPDLSLQNVPPNFLITINPGINYGTNFLDFGVAINNLVSYNLNDSKIIEDNPEQALQAHVMYTGYMNSRGFFDESKFSTLIRSEFKKDQTVISGIAMLNVPKGVWAQAGYNTLYGASAGVGINVTNNIAIEYNYEQSMGNFIDFGSSHEITLAYRFNNKYNYSYGDDDEQSVFNSNKRKRKTNNLTDEDRARIAERRAEIAERRKAEAEASKAEAELANTPEKPNASKNGTIEVTSNSDSKPAQKVTDTTNDTAEIPSALNLEKEAELKKADEEKLQQEAAKKRAEEQAKLRTQEEARKKLALEKQKADAEARVKAEEQKRLQLETEKNAQETREKAVEAAKLKSIEEARLEKAAVEKRKLGAEKQRLEVEAKAKVAEEERMQLEAEQKAEAEARAKAEEQKRVQFEAEKKAKEIQEKAIEEARLKLEAEKKAEDERKTLEAEAKARLEEEKQIAEQEAEAKRIEEAKAAEEAIKKAETAEVQVTENNTKEQQLPETDDEAAKNMNALVNETTDGKKTQEALMKQLSEKIAVKQKDLDDLKEENDLSEQGIYLDPKPFKSLTAENQVLETIKDEIDKTLENQNIKIIELEAIYLKRKKKVKDKEDSVNTFYFKTLERLKSEQAQIVTAKRDLMLNLEQIKEATDFERKRRIRRAAYDNQQDRFNKDKAALARIKKFTDESAMPLQEEDFDFGEEQTKNIQIIKNVLNEEPGYYMIIAVHNSAEKRDEFVTKVVASGEKDVNFFFDVKTNKYFIYYEKFDSISEAKNALDEKGSKPYNSKMSLIKIDN